MMIIISLSHGTPKPSIFLGLKMFTMQSRGLQLTRNKQVTTKKTEFLGFVAATMDSFEPTVLKIDKNLKTLSGH